MFFPFSANAYKRNESRLVAFIERIISRSCFGADQGEIWGPILQMVPQGIEQRSGYFLHAAGKFV